MSSVVGEGSCTLNHVGERKELQVLVGLHPCPSHRGLSVYMMIDSSFTEVVLSCKWWNKYSTGTDLITGASTMVASCVLSEPTSKCPNVLTGSAMHHTNSINIVIFN